MGETVFYQGQYLWFDTFSHSAGLRVHKRGVWNQDIFCSSSVCWRLWLPNSHFHDPNFFCVSLQWLSLEAPAAQVVVVLGAICKHAPNETLTRAGTRLMRVCKLFFSLYHTTPIAFFGENIPGFRPPHSQMRTIKLPDCAAPDEAVALSK